MHLANKHLTRSQQGSNLSYLSIPPRKVMVQLRKPGDRVPDRPASIAYFMFEEVWTEGGMPLRASDSHPFTEAARQGASPYRGEHSRLIGVVAPTEVRHASPLDKAVLHLRATNARLADVVAFMAEQTGAKLELDPALSEVRVSLRLDKITLEPALQALAKPHDWRVVRKDDGIPMLKRLPSAWHTLLWMFPL